MSKVPTNRQVIDTLRTLPENDPFGTVTKDDKKTHEFLESLYTSLKPLFGKASSSSNANLKEIQEIKALKISHQDRFPEYIQSPSVFWENDIKVLRYFNDEERTIAFLDSAYQLNQSLDDLLVLRRFVELAVYHLYHRAFPGALTVTIRNVEDFLVHSKVMERVCQNDYDATERDRIIQKYSEMIKRGQREHDFCVKMVKVTEVDGNDTVADNSIYGPLFIESIPEIFTPKGLLGTDYDKSVEHLKNLWTGQAAVEAEKIAKIVLDYHGQHVFWSSQIRADKGKKKRHRKDDAPARQRKKHRATAVEKPRSKGAPGHNVSDQVLSDSGAAQILNQMTRNVKDNGHGFVSDPTAHIIDPIARQVESNSGPSSARLSGSSTELDSPLFVYQNDSSVIIDESTPVQQPRTRSCHHELPSQKVASLAIWNQQAALATPQDSFSLPQNSEGFRQPARSSQQSESTQNSANFARITVASNDSDLLAIPENPAMNIDSLDPSNIAAMGVHPSTNMDFLDSNDSDLLATFGIHPTRNMDFLGPNDSEHIAAMGVHPSTNMDFLDSNDSDLLATFGIHPTRNMDFLGPNDSEHIAAMGVHPSTNMDFLNLNDDDVLATLYTG